MRSVYTIGDGTQLSIQMQRMPFTNAEDDYNLADGEADYGHADSDDDGNNDTEAATYRPIHAELVVAARATVIEVAEADSTTTARYQ